MSDYEYSSQVAELTARIKPIRFAMFATTDEQGRLHSHPMTSQHIDAEGNLWFFTSTETALWQDIAAHPEVNLSFAEPQQDIYVSVSGSAERVVDRAQIKAMWDPALEAWYPHGPDDPHVMLVKVVSHGAEYWDGSASAMVQLFQKASDLLTGSTPGAHQHARLDL